MAKRKISKNKRCRIAHGSLCSLCSKANELEALISQTRKTLDELLSQQQDLYMEINVAHGQIIHRLPPEISTAIFLFSLSESGPPSILDEETPDSTSKGDVITTPLTLGAVCRVWRNIVWASPRLWTNISIPVKPDPGFEYEYLDIAEEWLERSRNLPLSIRLYAPIYALFERDPTLLDCISTLMMDLLPRCHRLEVSCPLDLFPSMCGPAPMLDEIKVTSDHDVAGNDLLELIDLWSTKSAGIRVSMENYGVEGLAFPFENVEEFKGIISMDDFVNLMEKSPNIRECRIQEFQSESNLSVDLATHILHHHHLQKLTLSFPFQHPESSFLLQMLTLPALTHLTTRHIGIVPIHQLILRSGCNLRYLFLDSCILAVALYDMLCSTNSLEQLHIVECAFNDSSIDGFFQALSRSTPSAEGSADGGTTTSESSPFLPKLSALTLGLEPLLLEWDHVLAIFGSVDEIRNRFHKRRPLEKLAIIYDRRRLAPPITWPTDTVLLSEEVTRRFLDIVQEGINIDLYDVDNKADILLYSMARHGIAVPHWYSTNARDTVVKVLNVQPPQILRNDVSDQDTSGSEEDSE